MEAGEVVSNLGLGQEINLRIGLQIGFQYLLSHDRPGPVLQISQTCPGAGACAFAEAVLGFGRP